MFPSHDQLGGAYYAYGTGNTRGIYYTIREGGIEKDVMIGSVNKDGSVVRETFADLFNQLMTMGYSHDEAWEKAQHINVDVNKNEDDMMNKVKGMFGKTVRQKGVRRTHDLSQTARAQKYKEMSKAAKEKVLKALLRVTSKSVARSILIGGIEPFTLRQKQVLATFHL